MMSLHGAGVRGCASRPTAAGVRSDGRMCIRVVVLCPSPLERATLRPTESVGERRFGVGASPSTGPDEESGDGARKPLGFIRLVWPVFIRLVSHRWSGSLACAVGVDARRKVY